MSAIKLSGRNTCGENNKKYRMLFQQFFFATEQKNNFSIDKKSYVLRPVTVRRFLCVLRCGSCEREKQRSIQAIKLTYWMK